MKAKKIKMKIDVEVLSTDAISGLLHELAGVINSENLRGVLEKTDGDTVRWTHTQNHVDF